METIYIYNQNCVLAGKICYKETFYSDCTEYNQNDVLYAKFWLAHNRVKNSNDLFKAKVYRTIIEYFEGYVKNIRLAKRG